MRTNFRTIRTIFAAVVILAAATLTSGSCFAQEAKTETSLPEALTIPARTAVDAIDEQTAVQKKAADAEVKAIEENTAVMKALGAQQKAASDAAATKKFAPAEESGQQTQAASTPLRPGQVQVTRPGTRFTTLPYIIGGILLLLVVLLVVFRKKIFRRSPIFQSFTRAIVVVLVLTIASSAIAAPCFIPAGQPFSVTSLTVVRDSANPTAPTRAMVMADQERKFKITGCGFGWDISRVVVGFSGTKVGVNLDEVTNTHIIMRVKPEVGAELNYRNLAVAVTDQHGRKNLVRTAFTLEVAPPQAYWTLQAQEQRPVGTIQTLDRIARAAALAAARNANTAIDASRSAANAAVTLGTRFEQMFGKDGKSGTMGAEVVALRKDVNELQSFAKSADAELYYQDGSSRIDNLSSRVNALEQRGGGSGIEQAGFDQLRAEVAGLREQLNKFGSVTVGTIYRGTIAEKANRPFTLPTQKHKGKKGKDIQSPVSNPVQ